MEVTVVNDEMRPGAPLGTGDLPSSERDGQFVIDRFGEHVVVRGEDQHALMEKVRTMADFGGFRMVAGPIIHERLWICVLTSD